MSILYKLFLMHKEIECTTSLREIKWIDNHYYEHLIPNRACSDMTPHPEKMGKLQEHGRAHTLSH